MVRVTPRNDRRRRRHERLRQRVRGTSERPRLCVYKSLKHLYAQLIDDSRGHTIACASSLDAEFAGNGEKGKSSGLAAAKAVGALIAKRAQGAGVTQVIFDRGGYRYHGIVKALAETCRKSGLKL